MCVSCVSCFRVFVGSFVRSFYISAKYDNGLRVPWEELSFGLENTTHETVTKRNAEKYVYC